MINFPPAHEAYIPGVYKLIKENKIGRVWRMRAVIGHSGAES